MTDACVQTDDIIINGIPLNEYLKNSSVEIKNECDIWLETESDTSGDEAEVEVEAPVGTYLTEEERQYFAESILECIDEVVRLNALHFSDPLFHTKLESAIYEIINSNLTDSNGIFQKDVFDIPDEIDEEIEEIVTYCIDAYFNSIVPPRSHPTSFITHHTSITDIARNIEYLNSIPQHEQRTPEWYIRRYNMITASSAWKAFKSDSNINQLVYEKCKPLSIVSSSSAPGRGEEDNSTSPEHAPQYINITEKTFVNVNSPLHWGQKYEELSRAIYEARNNTKVGEFGCIPHSDYPFLGASPDGINIDPSSPLYGRMLEIKNIVNRDITGTPLEEYWIQMQLQMEVCKCDESDFLETRFKEYVDEEAFLADSASDIDTEFCITAAGTLKGIITFFMKNGKPIYEYAPLNITQKDYDKWREDIIDKNADSMWVKNIYWYLDQYSCVLVKRNPIWFKAAIPVIERVWGIILNERVSGYEHRAPKKRSPPKKKTTNDDNNNVSVISSSSSSATPSSSGCLIVISDIDFNL
uniref:YqaJ viral recombinase domain-containing protein n=1 Tax=viral metagenome TaxID=1070528 RepID=A0A6C0EW18_9ZZZZ